LPDSDTSRKFTRQLTQLDIVAFEEAPADFRFASTVAAFGMLLCDSAFKGAADWDWVVDSANRSIGTDRLGFRAEFVQLAKKARLLSSNLSTVKR
jgi:Ca-activated chloride channel family protein